MDIFKDLPDNEDDYVAFGGESVDRSFHTLDSGTHSPMKHELSFPQPQDHEQCMQNPIRNSVDENGGGYRKSSCSPPPGNPILIPTSRSNSTYRTTSVAASDTLWNQRSRQISNQFSFRGSASLSSSGFNVGVLEDDKDSNASSKPVTRQASTTSNPVSLPSSAKENAALAGWLSSSSTMPSAASVSLRASRADSSTLASPLVLGSSLKGNISSSVNANTKRLINDVTIVKANVFKITVADCFCVKVQNDIKLLYKLAIVNRNSACPESVDAFGGQEVAGNRNRSLSIDSERSNSSSVMRLVSKRLDEIEYLRMRIMSDFPNVAECKDSAAAMNSTEKCIPLIPSKPPTAVLEELIEACSPVAFDTGISRKSSKIIRLNKYLVSKAYREKHDPSAAFSVLESHLDELNKVIDLLITHPLAGPIALMDLGSSDKETASGELPVGVPSSLDSDVHLETMAAVEDKSTTSAKVSPVVNSYPLLINKNSCTGTCGATATDAPRSSLRVHVFGWTDLSTTTTISSSSSYTSRIVSSMRGGGAAVAQTMVIHFEIQIVYDDVIWICRKRYCQFRALLYAMKRLHSHDADGDLQLSYNDFNFPDIDEGADAGFEAGDEYACMKEMLGENLLPSSFFGEGLQPQKPDKNPGKVVNLSEADETKLTELTMSLDYFLKTLLQINDPLPPVLMAFLETDQLKVKSKFDVIPTGGSTVADSDGVLNDSPELNLRLIETDNDNYLKRKEVSELIKRKYNISTTVSNTTSNKEHYTHFTNFYNMATSTDPEEVPCLNRTSINSLFPKEHADSESVINNTPFQTHSQPENKKLPSRTSRKEFSLPGSARRSLGGADGESDFSCESDDSKSDDEGSDDGQGIESSLPPKSASRPISLSIRAPIQAPAADRTTLASRASALFKKRKKVPRQKLPVKDILKLPGVVLQELTQLIVFLQAEELHARPHAAEDADEKDRRNNTTGVEDFLRQDDVANPDFIDRRELIALDINAIYQLYTYEESANYVSAEPATFGSDSTSALEGGVWISQFRLRNALLLTSAFHEICRKVEFLRQLNMKDLHKDLLQESCTIMWTNEQKTIFCVNLYNLLSLHASIMLPWPPAAVHPHESDAALATIALGSFDPSSLSVIDGVLCNLKSIQSCQRHRILWQMNAKYMIGRHTLSLYQLEHAIIRALTPDKVYHQNVNSSTSNAGASTGTSLPSIMPNMDASVPVCNEVIKERFGPIIPYCYGYNEEKKQDSTMDPRVQFLLRLPYHCSISTHNSLANPCSDRNKPLNDRIIETSSRSRLGVLNMANMNIVLRQMTTEFITKRVRFIGLPKRADQMNILEKGDPEHNMQVAIVLPVVLKKYSKDFEKWQDMYPTSYETAMTSTYCSLSEKDEGVKKQQSKSNNYNGADDAMGAATQWDVAEKQQRSLDVMSSTNTAEKRIFSSTSAAVADSTELSMRSASANAYSGIDHSPLLAAYQDSLKNENITGGVGGNSESEAHYVSIITNGLLPETELFRICSLMMNNLEIKDRKYLLKEHKQAFLGR